MKQGMLKSWNGFAQKWCEILNWFSVLCIAVMLGITVLDIVCTKFIQKPVPGSTDLIGLVGLLCAASAISQTEVAKQHVRIDFIIKLFRDRIQNIFRIISSLFGLFLIAFVICSSVTYGINMEASRVGSLALRIPLFPFAYVISFCCIPLFLILLFEFIDSIRRVLKK